MEVIDGNCRKRPKPNLRVIEEKALLEQVYAAVCDLRIMRDEYIGILARSFGVLSAKCLSNQELKRLVNLFERMGWKPRASEGVNPVERELIVAWQEQVRETAWGLGAEWEKRLRTMLEEECGVSEAAWCQDVEALQRVCRRLEEECAGNGDPRRSGSSGR